MNDYPADAAERDRMRHRLTSEGAAKGRREALAHVTSYKCGQPPGLHADEIGGCRNNGSSCLCACHDGTGEKQ